MYTSFIIRLSYLALQPTFCLGKKLPFACHKAHTANDRVTNFILGVCKRDVLQKRKVGVPIAW